MLSFLPLIAAAAFPPFFLEVAPEVRTAYQSRGKVVEDRPMHTMLARTGVDAGDFGKIGFWHWEVTSLSGRRQSVHRRGYYETDFGLTWRHSLAIDGEGRWKIATEIVKDWVNLNGFSEASHRRKGDASLSEWRLGQSLVNPYVTPYYLFRRGVNSPEWFYARSGVRRRFEIADGLSIEPNWFAEFGDEGLFRQRFGGGRGRPEGVMSSNFMFELAWKFSDWGTLFASVHQFDLVSAEARKRVKAMTSPGGRRDLAIGAVGVRISF